MRTLDVRPHRPRKRHELIFETWFSLQLGEDFLLVNDHDPKPLYYSFAAEHDGDFTWSPGRRGPEIWEVRIGRTLRSA